MDKWNPFNKKEHKNRYEYFKDPDRRHDIYEFSKGVSTYLHDNKIPNIILLDRAPRPLWVGIDEYWKEHYQKEPRPDIYFVNPDGFNSIGKATKELDLPDDEILMDKLIMSITGESQIVEKSKEYDEKTREQFQQAYAKLENQKDKPLAVFDNCIHRGLTMLPVLMYLQENGYKDLRVVIGEISNDISSVRIDKHFTDKVDFVACRALGDDTFGVHKDEGNVFSNYDKEANRKKVIQSREEVRRIVQEKGV